MAVAGGLTTALAGSGLTSGLSGTLLGGIASGVASRGLGELFSGSRPQVGRTLRSANLPGLTVNQSGGSLTAERTPRAQEAIGEVQSLGREQAGRLRGLAEDVQPGMGRLTEARTQSLGAERRRTVGNLRDQLQRRRVLGSSFGADTVSRAESEFAMREDEARAESFMQELQKRSQLLDQAFQAEMTGAQAELEQLGMETQAASNLFGTMQNARLQAQQAQANIEAGIFEGNQQLGGQVGGLLASYFMDGAFDGGGAGNGGGD